MTLEEQLQALELEGLTYHRPAPGCNHWSIQNRHGDEIGCPHIGLPENLIQAIELISKAPQTSTETLVDTPAPRPVRPVPSPPRPLTFTPPKDLAQGDNSEPNFTDMQIIARGGKLLDNLYRITSPAWDYAQSKQIGEETILETLYSPLDIQPTANEREMYFGAQVRVVLAEDGRTVLSLSPLDPQYVPTPGIRRISQGSEEATPRMGSVDEAVGWMRARGFTVEKVNNGHYAITRPEKGGRLTMAATPSDSRWWLNTHTKLRLVFGQF